MINVFIAIHSPWNGNPFVSTIVESIAANHQDIAFGWGLEAFWNDDIIQHYDIIHFEWPSDILYTYNLSHTATELQNRLQYLKSKGKKIVSTCHNLKPHYCNDKNIIESYIVVYKESDIIIHLGEYSFNLFEKSSFQAKNILIYHHIYDTYYTTIADKKTSRNYLGWKHDKLYILCMGAIRDKEERSFIYTIAHHLQKKKAYLVVPSFLNLPTNSYINRIKRKIIKTYLRNVRNIVITGESSIPVKDKDIPFYYGGADITLIPRLNTLNSGTLFLSLLMGKPIIGPRVGNIGPLLEKLQNPTFDPQQIDSAVKCIDALCNQDELLLLGLRNREFALANLSTKYISEKNYNVYRSCMLPNSI